MGVFRLEGKNAIVTGAGSGIGRAISRALAKAGASVWAWDLDHGAARCTADIASSDPGRIVPAACDVADEQAVRRAAAEPGRVDILINNAGIAHVGNIEGTTAQDMDRLYAVNVKGVFHTLRCVVPRMLDQEAGGVIVNLASIASLIGIKDRFAYSMTKGAVLTMTYSVAVDYAERGIRCNCICPARVHTPFVDGFLAENYPGREHEVLAELSAYQPVGRMAKPQEIAHLALYLCSDEAAFITGSAFPIDGGVVHAK
ncbi:MAG: SDR family oxidoreductase [Planctomycetota bacterium]